MFEAFSNYSDFSGRARRSEYWLFQLLNMMVIGFSLILILVGGGAPAQGGGGMFFTGAAIFVFWVLIAFIPSIAVTVRRFHDHNISGWWYLGLLLFGLIPFVGLLANLGLLWVLVRGGTWGPNRYGPDPVNPWRGSTVFA
ncbi:MAG TPA: DUF805 domain-containing protein [Sphingomicrobium sp.]